MFESPARSARSRNQRTMSGSTSVAKTTPPGATADASLTAK